MCRRRDVPRVLSYDEHSEDAREVSRSGTDHTSSVVDTYLRRPYDSCPIALGAFLVPHFDFPVVRHLYLLSAVRVSFGGLS